MSVNINIIKNNNNNDDSDNVSDQACELMCDLCSVKIKSQRARTKRKNTAHVECICPECGYAFKGKKKLDSHMRSNKTFTCKHCHQQQKLTNKTRSEFI